MAVLATRDFEQLLGFVAVADVLGGDDPFCPPVLEQLGTLFPAAAWIGYTEVDRAGRCVGAHEHPPFADAFGSYDVARARALDPFRGQLGRRHRAVRLSDLFPQRALRQTSYYREVLAPLGIEDRLALVTPSPTGNMQCFHLDRTERRFSSRDRLMLDLMRPHLDRLWQSARTRRRLRAAFSGLEWTSEHDPGGVVLLAAGYDVEFASPGARRLIDSYFGTQPSERLPSELVEWLHSETLEVVRRRLGRRLTIHRSGDALLLEETRGDMGLTAREQEILTWVSRGKTNSEIAELLWIAPTTVRRHLEHVFKKLGVRTRTAAATRFLGLAEEDERDERPSA